MIYHPVNVQFSTHFTDYFYVNLKNKSTMKYQNKLCSKNVVMAQPSVFLERMKYIKCRVVIMISKKITRMWLFNNIPRQSFSKLFCFLFYLLYALSWLHSDYCVPIWGMQTTYGLWDTLAGFAAALFHQSNEELLKQILAPFAFCTPNSSWFVTPAP